MQAQVAQNRKAVLFMLFVTYVIASIDRYFINYAIVPISADLQLSASQTGLVLSSFFLGYAIMQMPGGWLADRFGARITIIGCIIAWSIFTGLTGIAWSLVALLIIRFIFGLGEGGFIPASAKMLADSFPHESRSRAMSILLTAAAFAGVFTPILSTIVITQFGWRPLFYSFGVIGILLSILLWFFLKPKLVTDTSVTTKLVDDNTIEENQKKLTTGQLFKTPMLWSLLIGSFAVFSINWGTTSWVPTYLVQVRGLDFTALGLWQMVPAVTAILFMLVAGQFVDKTFAGREKLLGVLCGIGMTVCVFLMFNATSIMLFIVYQSILPLFTNTAVILVTTLPIKKLPINVGGSAVGMVQSGGQFAGFIAPLFIGILIDLSGGSYSTSIAMLVGCGILFCLALLTLNVNKTISTNPESPAEQLN